MWLKNLAEVAFLLRLAKVRGMAAGGGRRHGLPALLKAELPTAYLGVCDVDEELVVLPADTALPSLLGWVLPSPCQ